MNDDFINAFIEVNYLILNKIKIDFSLSGVTCISLIIKLDKIIWANIGKTLDILARFQGGCYNTVNCIEHRIHIIFANIFFAKLAKIGKNNMYTNINFNDDNFIFFN